MIARALNAIVDGLIPSGTPRDGAGDWKTRLLVLALVFGPLFAGPVLLTLYVDLPNGRPALAILAAGAGAFWLFPLALRQGLRATTLALLAIANCMFLTSYASVCYGGWASPFLPWLLSAALAGGFCFKRRPLLLAGIAAAGLAGFLIAKRATGAFPQRLSAGTLSDIGVINLFAAAGFAIVLAGYGSQAAAALAAVKCEVLRQRARISRLRRVAQTAEHANSRKSAFLIDMTHRLRTPLNAVIGYSEMMLEDAQVGFDEQQLADVNRINLASKHLLSLMGNVLDISKIEASEIELVSDSFELARFFDNIAVTAQNLVSANANAFAIEIAAGIGVMVSDEVRLRQVVLNLLSNAGKFTKCGKVTLRATRENDGRIDWIRITVADTGIGIAPQTLEKLFADFNQADASIAHNYGGTGLGLSICRDFCWSMGGTIGCESEPGKGSRFIVRLPADVTDERAGGLLREGPARASAA